MQNYIIYMQQYRIYFAAAISAHAHLYLLIFYSGGGNEGHNHLSLLLPC